MCARLFSNSQAVLPLSTAACIFIFGKTVSLIFDRMDGNVTINLNICFFKAISLHLTQVHIFCISDNYKRLHCEEGPYKYEHYSLKHINLIFMNTETQYGNFFFKRDPTHFTEVLV